MWSVVSVAASLAILASSGASAQEPSTHGASPFLPPDHWAVLAARRLSALDLAPRDFGWGDGSLTRESVGRVLYDAVMTARERHPDLVAISAGYWARFSQEFPATVAASDHFPGQSPHSEGWVSIGYSTAHGRVFPVRSVDNTRDNVTGPSPRPDLSAVDVGANLSFATGPFLAGSITPERVDGDWTIREGYLLASWRKIGLWAGRRAPAFQTGAGGGIVLNGTAAFTGGGLAFTDPIRLPWILRHLGSIRFETFLSRIDSNATIPRPWFMATHASISPHPRLLLGVSQAFMFGGEGVAPFTWRNFKEMFFAHGIVTAGKEFENGIASGEIRFRPPSPLVPLSLYLEWGADDNHSAWTLFPGRVIGGQIPAVPGIPSLSLGFEHTSFSKPCDTCGSCHCEYYATWYRHYLFKDGWTLDREPIGHPLGGDGHEWLLYGTWDNPADRLRLDGRTFLRYRGPYNIYSPAHQGRSIGGSLAAVYRATSHLDVLFNGAMEDGHTGWRQSSMTAEFRWLF